MLLWEEERAVPFRFWYLVEYFESLLRLLQAIFALVLRDKVAPKSIFVVLAHLAKKPCSSLLRN